MDRRVVIGLPVPPASWDRRCANFIAAMDALNAECACVWEDHRVDECDGLLIPGGVDVDPARYGRENVACGSINPEEDAHQFAAMEAFVKAGKPVMGVCRGHQVVNVFFGGTLIQNVENVDKHRWDENDGDRAHMTRAVPSTFPALLYGESFPVNSAHHQAVETPGRGLIPVQWADDGIIEAMRHESLPVISVQWHPERMCLKRARPDTVDGLPVLNYFVEMCCAHRDGAQPLQTSPRPQ